MAYNIFETVDFVRLGPKISDKAKNQDQGRHIRTNTFLKISRWIVVVYSLIATKEGKNRINNNVRLKMNSISNKNPLGNIFSLLTISNKIGQLKDRQKAI